MKPVNLIPSDQRRNTSVAGRSGGAVYGVLGVLVIAVLLASVYAVVGRSINEKRAELADTRAQADKVSADAERLQVYTRFADLRQKRSETVASIARSRFDWPRAMREVARTLPAGVSLTSLTGTIAPGVTVDGGVSDPLRDSLPVPALVLAGCTPGQDAVARTMAELRRIEGVQRVSISSSEKGDAAGSDGCAAGPKFSIVVFFQAPASTATAAPAAAAAGTATASTAAPTSTGASK